MMDTETYQKHFDAMIKVCKDRKITSRAINEYMNYAPKIGFLCVIDYEGTLKADVIILARLTSGEWGFKSHQFVVANDDDGDLVEVDEEEYLWIDYTGVPDFSEKAIKDYICTSIVEEEDEECDVTVYYDIFTLNNILRSSSKCGFLEEMINAGESQERISEFSNAMSLTIRERLSRQLNGLTPIQLAFDEDDKKFIDMCNKMKAELLGISRDEAREMSELGFHHLYGYWKEI